jgi:hypothetical protein
MSSRQVDQRDPFTRDPAAKRRGGCRRAAAAHPDAGPSGTAHARPAGSCADTAPGPHAGTGAQPETLRRQP